MLDSFDIWPTLPVEDMERAKRFYSDRLGLELVRETDQWVSYRAGSGYLMLYPTSLAGGARHTLASWIVDDLERVVAELRERGIEFEEYDFPGLKTVNGIADLDGVERASWFKDSEGNVLAVSQLLVDATG